MAETSKGFRIPFEYNNGSYIAEANVGSNAENVSLQISAGSSTSVVLTPDAKCRYGMGIKVPEIHKDTCKKLGTFDVNASSTAVHIRDIDTYLGLFSLVGELVQDSFGVGGEWIDNFPFYVANDTQLPSGVLALGVGDDSVVIAMKNQSIIDKAIFSMHSNGYYGYLEFGDYDNSYDLKTFPVYDGLYKVPMESIDVEDNSVDTKLNATLDTSLYNSYFPSYVIEEIFGILNGTLDVEENNYGSFEFPCQRTDMKFKFNFDGLSLNVPFNDLLTHTLDGDCSLSLIEGPEEYAVIGQNLLSHSYVVFDLEEEEVSIAARDISNSSSSSNPSSESSGDSNESTQSESSNESTQSESSNESSNSNESSTSTSTSTSTSSSNSSSKLIPSSFLVLISILLS